MAGPVHVFDLLENTPADLSPGLCFLFGSYRFLQQLALDSILSATLGDEHDDIPLARYDGRALWRDVADELNTVSLFGSANARVVLVDEADSFLKEYRDRLEKMAEEPPAGLLILLLTSCNTSTRIYKALASQQAGRLVQCSAPKGRYGPDSKRIASWLQQRGRSEYQLKLTSEGAAWLEEVSQGHFGLMDQGLAKLGVVLEPGQPAGQQEVQQIVGGWKSESIWNMIDTAADGNSTAALQQLDKLIQAGEAPIAILGQVAWGLRRFASATFMFVDAESSGARLSIADALLASGFKKWKLEENVQRLKQIRRQRGLLLYPWIREADRALKDWASKGELARLMLEDLLVKLDSQLRPVG